MPQTSLSCGNRIIAAEVDWHALQDPLHEISVIRLSWRGSNQVSHRMQSCVHEQCASLPT
jgi:hypothetical protein